MRKFAIIALVYFLLTSIWFVCNLISGGKMGEIGNLVVGLAVNIPLLIFCLLYLTTSKILNGHTEYRPWGKVLKIAMRFLAGWNVYTLVGIIIAGIRNIIFNVNYPIGVSIAGLIVLIPMLIFCGIYLHNDIMNEAINKTRKRFGKLERVDKNK